MYQLLIFCVLISLSGTLQKRNSLFIEPNNNKAHLTLYKPAFVNSIVDGGKCNTFGYDKYVQNSDPGAAYTVTVKVEEYKAGSGSKEFQKVVSVPAGGKTYLGCSVSPATDGPSYTYTVIGESKQ